MFVKNKQNTFSSPVSKPEDLKWLLLCSPGCLNILLNKQQKNPFIGCMPSYGSCECLCGLSPKRQYILTCLGPASWKAISVHLPAVTPASSSKQATDSLNLCFLPKHLFFFLKRKTTILSTGSARTHSTAPQALTGLAWSAPLLPPAPLTSTCFQRRAGRAGRCVALCSYAGGMQPQFVPRS